MVAGAASQMAEMPMGTHHHETVMRFVAMAGASAAHRSLPTSLDDPGKAVAAVADRRRAFRFDEMTAANEPLLSGGLDAGEAPAMPGMDHSAHSAHADHMARSMAGASVQPGRSGLTMAIAGSPFSMDRIDAEVGLGTQEVWTLEASEMAHPFHIHGASFRVLSKGGRPPTAQESGWKDTVLVETDAELLVRFDQPASRARPFMFHCHVLEHEDLGMMAQYVTV